jgi:hypothetical protein
MNASKLSISIYLPNQVMLLHSLIMYYTIAPWFYSRTDGRPDMDGFRGDHNEVYKALAVNDGTVCLLTEHIAHCREANDFLIAAVLRVEQKM